MKIAIVEEKRPFALEEIVVGRDDNDLKKYEKKGTILIGKHIVGTGEDAHMTTPLLLDVLRPHVMMITGKRGSGKSWLLGVIAEEFANLSEDVRENLCALIIDTQGIFWTMKSPNEQELSDLNEWRLKPMGFSV